MNRRQFIGKTLTATAAVAASATLLEGCAEKKQQQASEEAALGEIPTDQMTYRQGKHGESVSLLGKAAGATVYKLKYGHRF